MAKTKFTCVEGAWFEIGGRTRVEKGWHVDDIDLVGDFLKWQRENDIYAAFTASSGLGMWIGFFTADDVPAVVEWLKERDKR